MGLKRLFLEQLDMYRFSETIAMRSHLQDGIEEITYADLVEQSDRLAGYILRSQPHSKKPIPVYGHKRCSMLVALLAAVKAGRAYCPIDTNMPKDRVQSILEQVEPDIVLLSEPISLENKSNTLELYDSSWQDGSLEKLSPEELRNNWVRESDTFYILFTSGSSGTPKGVEITYSNLNHFLDWSVTFFSRQKGLRFLNQAPFSFDLSVMDLFSCLYTEGTLVCMSKDVQNRFAQLWDAIQNEGIQFWVSTPSFANLCLQEPTFREEKLPHLQAFWFCGETLPHSTARELKLRFPRAAVFNTYGPTESTVAVTSIEITEEILDTYNPLPIGKAKPGTSIQFLPILEEDAQEEGEIVIHGNTVSAGYFQRPDLNTKSFGSSEGVRWYRTGDRGYLRDGWLFYEGRIDFQVKLHGYRIELGDIENNLSALPYIKEAVVLPRYGKEGEVTGLRAVVVYEKTVLKKLAVIKEIKESLREVLPEYMIPKNFEFVEALPMTLNGKVDRKALEGLYA